MSKILTLLREPSLVLLDGEQLAVWPNQRAQRQRERTVS